MTGEYEEEEETVMATEKSPEEVADMIPDGATPMAGGFLSVGTPERIMDALVGKTVSRGSGRFNDSFSAPFYRSSW